MIYRPIFTAILLSATPLAFGQNADLPQVDAVRILQEIETLVSRQESQQKSLRQKQLNTLKPATSSSQASAKLFEEAVKAQSESTGRPPSFSEWRRANSDELRSASFQSATQLHARYLQMGLEHDPQKPDISADSSWEYAQALARVLSDTKLAPSTPMARELLFKPAKGSEISQWLEIGSAWPADKTWAPQAGNLEDILNKNVRFLWRENRDPRLISTWDLQIRLGEESAKNNEQAAQDFARNQKPRLLFHRARDLAVIGQPNRAVNEILSIAQSNPSHPDFPVWVNELKSMLKSEPPEPDSENIPQ